MNVTNGKQNVTIGQYQEFATQLDAGFAFNFNSNPVVITD